MLIPLKCQCLKEYLCEIKAATLINPSIFNWFPVACIMDTTTSFSCRLRTSSRFVLYRTAGKMPLLHKELFQVHNKSKWKSFSVQSLLSKIWAGCSGGALARNNICLATTSLSLALSRKSIEEVTGAKSNQQGQGKRERRKTERASLPLLPTGSGTQHCSKERKREKSPIVEITIEYIALSDSQFSIITRSVIGWRGAALFYNDWTRS